VDPVIDESSLRALLGKIETAYREVTAQELALVMVEGEVADELTLPLQKHFEAKTRGRGRHSRQNASIISHLHRRYGKRMYCSLCR